MEGSTTRLRDHIGENTFNQNQITSSLQPANPPTYPCSEKCINCNRPVVNGEQDENNESEQTQLCDCECHKQDLETLQSQTQFSKDNVEETQNQPQAHNPIQMTMTNNHIPPSGDNCLPGCGYSGLPCYNCSMGHTQASGSTDTSSAPQGYFASTQSAEANPGYPVQPNVQGYPHIYTVDLMNNSQINQDRLSQTQVLLTEGPGRRRSRKRYCLSIIVSVIAINIAIAFFRMMIRGTVSRY